MTDSLVPEKEKTKSFAVLLKLGHFLPQIARAMSQIARIAPSYYPEFMKVTAIWSMGYANANMKGVDTILFKQLKRWL